jgi:phosphonate transport system permease protein
VTNRTAEIRKLHGERPRSRFLRVSTGVLVALGIGAWFTPAIRTAELFSADRMENLKRFFKRDAMPYPLRAEGWSLTGLADWVAEIWRAGAGEVAATTLWTSVVPILLAGGAALALSVLGARTLARPDPYLEFGPGAERAAPWRRALVFLARLACVLMRAIPEYILAFLLLALLGTSAWPAILALAVHNAGILGRLGADTVENLDPAPLRALRTSGTNRRGLALLVAIPLALPRLLLYFFYRFETCVREATVLGLLGIASLGALLQEARARQRYDEMLLLVAVGGAIVLLADLVSQLARFWIRREN